MACLSSIRSRRRSAGERHALLRIERDIRSVDPKLGRKYLNDFAQAYSTYERVLSPEAFNQQLLAADIVLLGDYHALPSSQRFAAQMVGRLAGSGKATVLALETVFARDQRVLDSWMAGEISEEELRQRIHFDSDWGFDWEPIANVMLAARQHSVACYGLDCARRHDLRTISLRDRHAALKLAEARDSHPRATTVALFGESHLAPNHLPNLLRKLRPQDRILTILQNVDSLYWQAAGERRERVEAVEVGASVLCVFNATPLEKYQSYHHYIERWRQEKTSSPDLAPAFYNLIEALAHFLGIDPCSPHNGTQPRFLVDQLPEVRVRPDTEGLRKLLLRHGIRGMELANLIGTIERTQSCYLERLNAIFATGFDLVHAATQCARFLHLVCSKRLHPEAELPLEGEGSSAESRFYACVMDEALADCGARVLHPARPLLCESDLFALYAAPAREIEQQTLYTYREYMQMVDFLVLHRDYESNSKRYFQPPQLIIDGVRSQGDKFQFLTRKLGGLLGSDLFRAYLEGKISKRYLRSLYFRSLQQPGVAEQTYFECARKAGIRRRSTLPA